MFLLSSKCCVSAGKALVLSLRFESREHGICTILPCLLSLGTDYDRLGRDLLKLLLEVLKEGLFFSG
jgi:hypothetical protein